MENNKTSKEYFIEVCDALGNHYEKKGFKYSKSRPKITLKDKKIKLEITFWSSRINDVDSFINLEILPNFSSIELKKSRKGFMFGHTAIFYKKKPNQKPNQVIINQIYGDTLFRIDEHRESTEIVSNNCNIYNINEEKLSKIIDFIDSKIIIWFNKIQTKEGILELTLNPSEYVSQTLKNSENFLEYCSLNGYKTNLN